MTGAPGPTTPWAYSTAPNDADPATSRFVRARVIVIPVINPDGFNISREAGEAQLAGGGRGGNETVNIVSRPLEYRRKNCRPPNDAPSGTCATASQGVAEPGVDPNRNYGGFWGGPGASTDPTNLTYRGPGPFSEPETQNVRDLVSKRQVTTLITNHTFSALVLRPPGIQLQGPSPDEAVYKALGDAMAAENGYLSQLSYQLYDTTSTTEDWSYYATGGPGFTFEIGCNDLDRPGGKCDAANFHPPYVEMIAEYDGTSPLSDDLKPDGGGNREAYFKALENTADASKHSVLEGSAPAGAVLRLKKPFKTKTFPQADGKPIEFDDTLETVMDVPSSGQFKWDINPSTRPVVAQNRGRPATGEPSAPISFAGDTSTTPLPCPSDQSDPSCWNDFGFAVPSGAGVDNARASVRIQWGSPASDWDMTVFEDSNGDGSSVGETKVVGSSAQGTTDYEETTFSEPVLKPGVKYVVRVVNFAAVEPYEGTVKFGGPEPFQPGRTESWKLTCERDGAVLGSQDVLVGRGERKDLGAVCGTAAATTTTPTPTPTPTSMSGILSATAKGSACASASLFSSAAVRPSGRAVRFDFATKLKAPVRVDVFQVAAGRRVLGERLVRRFTNRTRSFTWDGRASGGKRVRAGYQFARYTLKSAGGLSDVRRKVLRYSRGRFTLQPDFYRRESCTGLRSFKLERATFGGSGRRSLGAAFRLDGAAKVTLQVLRGGRVVRTLTSRTAAANTTYRARLGAKGLRAGLYKFKLTIRQGAKTSSATLSARRL